MEVAADEVRTGPVNDSSLGFGSCRLGMYLATPSGIHPASAETTTANSDDVKYVTASTGRGAAR